MKTFTFKIKLDCTGYGVVEAKDIESAKKKILKHDWDEIYDTLINKYGEIIEIRED